MVNELSGHVLDSLVGSRRSWVGSFPDSSDTMRGTGNLCVDGSWSATSARPTLAVYVLSDLTWPDNLDSLEQHPLALYGVE
jgi:hypothetical protein